MGIHAKHLREHVVRPVLVACDLWSEAAENLLMGTAAQESDGFRALVQYSGGPALGLFQVEPATYKDYMRFLNRASHEHTRQCIARHCFVDDNRRDLPGNPEAVVYNLRYAAAMCRVHYLRIRRPLPDANDVWALAAYWKKYYNTAAGKGTVQEFVDNYRLTK